MKNVGFKTIIYCGGKERKVACQDGYLMWGEGKEGYLLEATISLDVNSQRQKQIRAHQGPGGMGGMRVIANAYRISFLGNEMFWNQIVVVDAQLCEHIKSMKLNI